MAYGLIPLFSPNRFVDESRALVDALRAELKEILEVQRSAALERKARVTSVPSLGKFRVVLLPGCQGVRGGR